MALRCMGCSSWGRNIYVYMAKQDNRHWSRFLTHEVKQEPQALARILKPLPKVHWSSSEILEIWKEIFHMFPVGYMPFQYGDGKSLIEASVIIIMMKNHKDNTSILLEKENIIHLIGAINLKNVSIKTIASLL